MKSNRTVMSAAILAAFVSFAGSASAITVNYSQTTGFLFEPGAYTGTSVPQANYIGHDAPVVGLPNTYESLVWGADVTTRGQAAPSTPIITTQLLAPGVWTATAAPYTTNNTPDSAVKLLGLSGSITSVSSYVAPDPNYASAIAAGWVPISTVFHSNQAINNGSDGLLSSGKTNSSLQIGTLVDNNVGTFNFFETPNNQAAYNCPAGPIVSCDIFQLPGGNYAPIVYAGADGKLYDIYFSFIFASPGTFVINDASTWGNNACQDGYVCVLTQEDRVNYLTTGMLMVARAEVPEPGSLALLGLGLAGLAGLRRRKIF